MVIGIGALSNVLKLLLARYERPAHAVLLGLLLGSVLGLWPFREAVHPELVTREGVQAVELLLSGEELDEIRAETGVEWTQAEAGFVRAEFEGLSRGDLKLLGLELEPYGPTFPRIAGALGLFVFGFLLTRLLSKGEPA